MCTRFNHPDCGKRTFVCAECHLMKWNRDSELCEGCTAKPFHKTRLGGGPPSKAVGSTAVIQIRFRFNRKVNGEKLTQ